MLEQRFLNNFAEEMFERKRKLYFPEMGDTEPSEKEVCERMSQEALKQNTFPADS